MAFCDTRGVNEAYHMGNLASYSDCYIQNREIK